MLPQTALYGVSAAFEPGRAERQGDVSLRPEGDNRSGWRARLRAHTAKSPAPGTKKAGDIPERPIWRLALLVFSVVVVAAISIYKSCASKRVVLSVLD